MSWDSDYGYGSGAVTRGQTVIERFYIGITCLFTTLGLATAAVFARVSMNWEFSNKWWYLAFIFGCFGAALLGGWIFQSNDSAVVSLFGTSLTSGAMGLMVGPLMTLYTHTEIVRSFYLTAAVTVVMALGGIIYPRSLESWGKYLFGGLTVLLIGLFGVNIAALVGLNIGGPLNIIEWFAIVLFIGYIVYDLNQAKFEDRTWNNAIDRSGLIFLDVFNLWLWILSHSKSN